MTQNRDKSEASQLLRREEKGFRAIRSWRWLQEIRHNLIFLQVIGAVENELESRGLWLTRNAPVAG